MTKHDATSNFQWCRIQQSGVSLKNSTWAQCRETVMINLAAPKLTLLSKDRIVRTLLDNAMTIVKDDPSAPITIWAKK